MAMGYTSAKSEVLLKTAGLADPAGVAAVEQDHQLARLHGRSLAVNVAPEMHVPFLRVLPVQRRDAGRSHPGRLSCSSAGGALKKPGFGTQSFRQNLFRKMAQRDTEKNSELQTRNSKLCEPLCLLRVTLCSLFWCSP